MHHDYICEFSVGRGLYDLSGETIRTLLKCEETLWGSTVMAIINFNIIFV
jgi:hypothetical protein